MERVAGGGEQRREDVEQHGGRVHLRAAVSTVRKGFGTNRKPKRPEVVAVEAMQERVKERR